MIPWVGSHTVNEKWFELHGNSVTHGGHLSLLEPQIKQGVAFQMKNCCEQKRACLPISSLGVCSVILLQELTRAPCTFLFDVCDGTAELFLKDLTYASSIMGLWV